MSRSSRAGLALPIAGILASSVSMTVFFGMYAQWPFVILGIGIGLLAGKSINRH